MLIENFLIGSHMQVEMDLFAWNKLKNAKKKPTKYQAHMNLRPFIDCSQQRKKRTEITQIAHRYSAWKLARKLFNFQVRNWWGAFEKWTSIKDHRTCNSNRHTLIRSCTRFSTAPEFKWQKEIAKHQLSTNTNECFCSVSQRQLCCHIQVAFEFHRKCPEFDEFFSEER